MDISCNMGETLTGIGYRWFGAAGFIGSKITTGIIEPSAGIYYALGVTPPNGARGVTWTDDGTATASETFPLVQGTADSTPFETCRQLILGHFQTEWDADPLFPVGYENHTVKAEKPAWGQFSVQQGATEEPAVGQRFTRGIGIAYLSIFLDRNTGTTLATQAADAFGRIFNRRTLATGNVTVKMQTAAMIDTGPRDGYIQKNLACSFTRDCYPS